MDTRNVIAAISLSAAVIILYSLFFAPVPETVKKNVDELKKIEQGTDTPSLDQKEKVTEISREEALSQSKRIQFENQSIVGSISLKGAAIDDLIFKEYKVSLDSDKKVKLLSPRNSKDGYFIESGFITTDKNINIPNSESIWTISGNNKLTDQSPIKLSWANDQGIIFEKEIFNNKNVPTRTEIMENLIPYIQEETSKGTQLNHIMRHTVGLFHGQNGSRTWKQYLSKNMCIRDADLQKVNHIMDQVKKTNPVFLER